MKPMKLLMLLTCFLLCPGVEAQGLRGYVFLAPTFTSGPSQSTSTGYGILPPSTTLVSVAPGNNSYAGGGGGEWVFGKYFGAGVDLTAILPGQGKVLSGTLGVVSPDAYWHLLSTRKSDLFFVGGYSLLVRDYTANGLNTGVGWNYWFHENFGLSIEARTIFLPGYTAPHPPDNHYTEIRFGLTFR
jgi:hypothetical protein